MFKFSGASQIWKKYIQKVNAWDLSLNPGSGIYKAENFVFLTVTSLRSWFRTFFYRDYATRSTWLKSA